MSRQAIGTTTGVRPYSTVLTARDYTIHIPLRERDTSIAMAD